ncbi:MAG: glycosyltransferase family 39 protein [Solirubrobacterales bacterium]|nr:glycosyltransferase family 39 protein [Solirubrobacterales bacterium]
MSTRTAVLPSLPAAWRARRAAACSPEADAATHLALRAMLGSRAIVWGAGLLALALFGQKTSVSTSMDVHHLTAPFGSAAANFLSAPAARWDSVWYLTIAHAGYPTPASSAFFPLYPLLIRGGALVLGSELIAGTLISFLAMTTGLYLLHRLVRLDLAPAQARATVMLVAFFPASLFLSAVYTEALFLMLSVGAIYAARLERWAWAGVLGALAAATRSGGVLLVVPLMWLYLYGPRSGGELAVLAGRRRGWVPRYRIGRSVAWLALVPAGLLAYMGYLGLAHHAPLAAFQAEAVWGRHFAGPFGGLLKALADAPTDLRLGLSGHTVAVGAAAPVSWQTHNLIDLALVGFAAAGLVLSRRRIPLAYTVYAVALLVQALSYPVVLEPLESFPRYLLVIFPVFMGWGAWLGERPRLYGRVIASSAALLAGFSALWAIWAWVA